jgi:uncharacterized protein YciI
VIVTQELQFLYRVQPTRPAMLTEGPTPREMESVSRHFEYLQGLTRRDIVLLAGRTLNTDPSSFGIVIFRAASEDEARVIMLADPAVREGVMSADLFPYRIALAGRITPLME